MQLSHTSVPLWADPSPGGGRGCDRVRRLHRHLLRSRRSRGGRPRTVLDAWASDLATGACAVAVLVLHADDPAAAGEALGEALGRAQVGVRVRLAGPCRVCLALRGPP